MTEADKIGDETLGLTQYEQDLNTKFEQRAAALPEAHAQRGQSEEAIVAEQFGGQVNDLVDMNEVARAQDQGTAAGRDSDHLDVQGIRSSVPSVDESVGGDCHGSNDPGMVADTSHEVSMQPLGDDHDAPGGQNRPMNEDEKLNKALEDSFPTSDSIQPSRIDKPNN